MTVERPYNLLVLRLALGFSVATALLVVVLDVGLGNHPAALLSLSGILAALLGAGLSIGWYVAERSPHEWRFDPERALLRDIQGRREIVWHSVSRARLQLGEYRGWIVVEQLGPDGLPQEVRIALTALRSEALASFMDELLAHVPQSAVEERLVAATDSLLARANPGADNGQTSA